MTENINIQSRKILNFIEKSNKIHKNYYDYSKSKYKNCKLKILIICPIHGKFYQTPDAHINGKSGCCECSRIRYSNKKIKQYRLKILDIFYKVHKNRYDYSEFFYKDAITKSNIKCQLHGIFKQSADVHKRGVGCPKCAKNRELTQKEILEQFRKIHKNRYNYSQVNYINEKTKIKIKCKKHGFFSQTPNSHKQGHGCSMCGYEIVLCPYEILQNLKKIHKNKYDYHLVDFKNKKSKQIIIYKKFKTKHLISLESLLKNVKCSIRNVINKNEFIIQEFKKIHKNKYDYSKIKYIGGHKKIAIICKKHGIFKQTPSQHKSGKNCPNCVGGVSISKNDVINQFEKKHNSFYDYSKVNYIRTHTLVDIVCPTHGTFSQTPAAHKQGAGCPICKNSKGENVIFDFLKEKKINYIRQKKFNDCKNKKKLSFDFYLPDYNICIEYDGEQHFKPIKFFGGVMAFKDLKNRDEIKKHFCRKQGIHLIRISYQKFDKIKQILSNIIK